MKDNVPMVVIVGIFVISALAIALTFAQEWHEREMALARFRVEAEVSQWVPLRVWGIALDDSTDVFPVSSLVWSKDPLFRDYKFEAKRRALQQTPDRAK